MVFDERAIIYLAANIVPWSIHNTNTYVINMFSFDKNCIKFMQKDIFIETFLHYNGRYVKLIIVSLL